MSSLLMAAEMSLLVTLMLYTVENLRYIAKVRISVQFSFKTMFVSREAVLCNEQTGAPGETDDVLTTLHPLGIFWKSMSKKYKPQTFCECLARKSVTPLYTTKDEVSASKMSVSKI